ncbi:hypothetical protein KFL_002590160 [Klebsormidium nitens]|uniref:Uncharacterized protein n=1 Tax=Klebsormidium nitens TaxID=105231 RepID=A0A1Y1ICT4_KLENI|nr:hypothetical protein KFL_002590160 [Klebsormidium nitens]|eukprot:GAQ85888.1 hypothetical protein KFL_002590160 [Klebsormidium nitens]
MQFFSQPAQCLRRASHPCCRAIRHLSSLQFSNPAPQSLYGHRTALSYASHEEQAAGGPTRWTSQSSSATSFPNKLAGCRGFAASASEGSGSVQQVEAALEEKLRSALDATRVKVTDTSGGCGTMYEIVVESNAFQGKNTLQQHRMVNSALAGDVEKWHGFTLRTLAPKE